MRKALYLMGVLDDSDIEWMVSHGHRRFFESGAVLIHEGTPVDCLFILLDGNLSVATGVNNSKQLAILHSGEVVGEISLVDSRPPLASVTVLRNAEVLALPRARLEQKLGSDPSFAARFYRAIALYLADRLRTTSRRLGYGDADQDAEAGELDFELMDNISMAATRFDGLLRRLRAPVAGSTA